MTETRQGWLYDGLTAVRHEVTVVHRPGTLGLVETGDTIPITELHPLGDRSAILFGRAGWEGWRLGLEGPLPPEWAVDLPGQEHHGGILDRFGVLRVVAVCALLAVAAVFIVVQATSFAARLMPESWEIAFGDALTGDFGGAACEAPAGQQALDQLAARLSSDGKPVRVRVVDLPIVNAVALPGRRIVLFDGLIKDAKSPDEVAGVLAHEIGHVEQRHVMTSLVRQFGLGLLLGGTDGGTIANSLLSSRYSRGAEHEADVAALAALRRADVSPAPTAGFFARLGKGEEKLGQAGRMMNYLGTHPITSERRALFARAIQPGHAYRASLAPGEWQAIRTMCATPTPVGEIKVKRP